MRRFRLAVVLLVLPVLAMSTFAAAETTQRVSVTAADGTLSVDAIDSPLDRVLGEIGETIRARILIETVLADDLARARVTSSFTRVPVMAALQRLLRGRQYVVLSGPTGVDEVRIYVDGASGYRELSLPDPKRKNQPTSLPLPGWPPDDPAEVSRLRQAALNGPDASARAEALEELSNIRDTGLLLETFAQVLARERDSKVLERMFELAAQQHDRIPPERLRTFAVSDRDGTPRAQAVELLADQAGTDPATLILFRSLARNDVSAEVRQAAKTALENLESRVQ